LPSVSALAKISYTNTTLGRNLFDTIQNNIRFKNLAFLFDPDIKQIGIVTDKYVYVHNLISGKEDFRSSENNLPLNEPSQLSDKKSLQTLSDAYYQTAKYMLLNNKKIKKSASK
jgi:hypothetical protein